MSSYFELIECRYTLEGSVDHIVFSADNSKLIAWSHDGCDVKVWDLRSGELINELFAAGAEDGGKKAITPDGEILVYNMQNWLHIRHVLSGEELFTIELDFEPLALATLQSRTSQKAYVSLIAATSGNWFRLPRESSVLINLELLRNKSNIVTNTSIRLTIIPTQQYPAYLVADSQRDAILVSPDGDAFLCQTTYPTVDPQDCRNYQQVGCHQLWDYHQMEPLRIFETSSLWRADALAQDWRAEEMLRQRRYKKGRHKSRLLASGTRGGSLKVWDLHTDEELYSVPGKSPSAMTPDGRLLVCSTENNGILIWDVVNQQPLHTLEGHPHLQQDYPGQEYASKIRQVALSANYDLVSTDAAGTIKIWG